MSLRLALERASHRVIVRRRLPPPFEGARIYVSTEGGLRYLARTMAQVDPALLKLAAEVVRRGDTVWDIGANMGLFSFAAAVMAGPEGRVLAVEPDTDLVGLLRRSAVGAAGHAPVEILPAAVSDDLSVARFHIARRNRATSHLAGFGSAMAGGVRSTRLVPTVTLDWLAVRFPAPDVLKIDVEGAELAVLAGGGQVLAGSPAVICEVSGQNAAAVSGILAGHGYTLYDGDQVPGERVPVQAAPFNTLAIAAGGRRYALRKPPPLSLRLHNASAKLLIVTTGWLRRHRKVMAWTAGGLALLLLGIGVTGYAMFRHFNDNIDQANITPLLGERPADPHPQAENIVVIGSDTRVGAGMDGAFGTGLTTDQSDTLMVIHIPADRKWAEVMSIPRDSYVDIPACTMGNGKLSAPTQFKINEAFAIGNLYGNRTALGAACTIKTIEQDTGLYISHFIVVNFTGFENMVAALGGVEECSPVPLDAPGSGLDLPAGYHMLNATEALAYVRAREGLGNGSDLERIVRQQAFMTSLISRAKSELYNPLAIYQFLDAATQSLTIDSQLGGLIGLYNLDQSLRSIPPSKIALFTLPNFPRADVVPTDTANVLWTQPEDSEIFALFRDDAPASASLFEQATAAVRPGKYGVSPGSPAVDVSARTASQSICVS